MQLKKLKTLVKQGESDTLEFKQSTGRLHDGLRTVCAFLQPLHSWESLTSNTCTINDLDKTRIREIVHVGIAEGRITALASRSSIPEILKKFELMDGERLTNAAVVLFCKKEPKQFIQSEVRFARFAGTDKSIFQTQGAQKGNLFDLYEKSMEFLRNYLPVAGRIEEGNPFRVNTPAIPYNVLREALVNALCHRDYASRGGSISIGFYDDRVEIVSPGRLPKGVKLNELKKEHESRPRNKLIAKVLYACGMIEHWGRGTLEMVQLCKKSGNPAPIFAESSDNFWVVLPLKEPVARVKVEHMVAKKKKG